MTAPVRFSPPVDWISYAGLTTQLPILTTHNAKDKTCWYPLFLLGEREFLPTYPSAYLYQLIAI